MNIWFNLVGDSCRGYNNLLQSRWTANSKNPIMLRPFTTTHIPLWPSPNYLKPFLHSQCSFLVLQLIHIGESICPQANCMCLLSSNHEKSGKAIVALSASNKLLLFHIKKNSRTFFQPYSQKFVRLCENQGCNLSISPITQLSHWCIVFIDE